MYIIFVLFHYIFFIVCSLYMHVHFPLCSYIFSKSSDSLNLHIQIDDYLLLIRYLERITCILRSWSSLTWYPFSVFSFFSLLLLLSWFYALDSCLFHFLFICYNVRIFICDIAVILIYHSDYIACSVYFRLSVYTWGIFLVYIRHRLSLWLYFHAFCEARCDTIAQILRWKRCSRVIEYFLDTWTLCYLSDT